jgi:hypothetical protein
MDAAGQSPQKTEPKAAECLPGAQSVQAELAADVEYLPGSHAVQAFLQPAFQYCPAVCADACEHVLDSLAAHRVRE